MSSRRKAGDLLGEAKACANLGICYRAIKKYHEAVVCAKRQLQICRGFNDKVSAVACLQLKGPTGSRKRRVLSSKVSAGKLIQ